MEAKMPAQQQMHRHMTSWIVERTAKKRLKRMKAFVKYFSMRKAMKEQS